MSDSQAAGEQEQHPVETENAGLMPLSSPSQKLSVKSGSRQLSDTLYPESMTQPLIISSSKSNITNAPRWLRPFFSLRVQLTAAYTLLALLATSTATMFTYRETSSLIILATVLGIVVVGSIVAFFLTSLLLRPLWRVTDAAQAIAVGDLEQREKLPLRLPPQDEIDRLAGSLNEMVTKLEHAQEMQRASEERFQRFFSDASHQLRTPLTSIRGFTELLLRGAKNDSDMSARILSRMKNETDRMTNLINDLLTIARLDNKHPLKLKYVDLVELAVESIDQTRTRAKDDRQIVLNIATERRLGIQADRERIAQLFFILLDNALKHGRPAPEGVITLKLDRDDDQVHVLVMDNGDGIVEEDLGHIFEAFYRGRHHGSTPATVGAGLGLTIASAITRAHQGYITVCSEPGIGTEFRVTLPCVD